MVSFVIKLSSYNTHVYEELNEIYQPVIDELNQLDLISDQDIEIIITETFQKDIEDIAKEWQLDVGLTKEKEYWAVAKSLTNYKNNNRQHKIILEKYILYYVKEILFHQIILLKREYYLPDYLIAPRRYDLSVYNQAIEYTIQNAIEAQMLWGKMDDLKIGYVKNDDAVIYLEEFKRKIKKIHYKYQSDNDLHDFNRGIISSINDFFFRCIESNYSGARFDDFGDFKTIIHKLIEWVKVNINYFESHQESDLNNFKMILNEILKNCYNKIEPNIGGYIISTITKNPKLLFKKELLDTESCFVAFVDILGFTNIIKEYDNNIYSNQLKHLKKALEESIKYATNEFNIIYNNQSFKDWGIQFFPDELSELLEYRMFSDCFCFSLPYFENEKDFITQFASLIIVLRIFQFLMLKHDFIVRGGVAVGSFYSDKNMIFSGGLVKAYNLEKQATFPRIIIDDNIIKRIKSYSNNNFLFNLLGLSDSIIVDNNNENFVFINPLGLDKEIQIEFGNIVDDIEPLYNYLGVSLDGKEEIVKYLKLLNQTSPSISQIPLSLKSPLQKIQLVLDDDYKNIYVLIAKKYEFYSQIEDPSDEDKNILYKYSWLLQYANWAIVSNFSKNDNFEFVFKKIIKQ